MHGMRLSGVGGRICGGGKEASVTRAMSRAGSDVIAGRDAHNRGRAKASTRVGGGGKEVREPRRKAARIPKALVLHLHVKDDKDRWHMQEMVSEPGWRV